MDAKGKTRSRAGRPRAEELGERTEALLSITEALLVERGYERTTLNLIARSAGVSKQTIYAKYGGKPGLLRAVLQRMSEQSMSMRLGEEDELPLYEGLLMRICWLLEQFSSEAAVAIATISEKEARNFPEFHQEMVEARQRNLKEPLRRHFENLRRRGLVKEIDCDRVAALLLWVASEDVVATAATGRRQAVDAGEMKDRAAFIAGFFTDATAA